MVRKDIVMLTQEELKKVHVAKKVLEGVTTQIDAAKILSLSDRQIRRIINRIKVEGEKGAAHRSRGKPSGRKLSLKIKEKVILLYKEKYHRFGPTLMAEKLNEIEGIKISDETIRLWLMASGDWQKKRKVRQHRQWRERKEYFGEMVQMDGSHHDWFEGRGPKCVFMGYIDDATGKVFGRFYEYEGTIPAMDSFRQYVRKNGIPMSVYLDKHMTYKSPAEPSIEDELNGTQPMSEFERAMKELGVKVIHAHSPQAKGRIERWFNTLQDRLVKEMRLKGISTIEQANIFLKEYLLVYDKKFSVKPRKEENFHREIPNEMKLDQILCIKTERKLKNDFTISYEGKLYQILEKTNAKKVWVIEQTNGKMKVMYKEESLKFKEITWRPEKAQKKPLVLIPENKFKYVPPPDHSWRNFKFSKQTIKRSNFEKTESSLLQT